MAESFMRTLKREEVIGQAYRDRSEAVASIEAFIETVEPVRNSVCGA
jgi:hypothetical protein